MSLKLVVLSPYFPDLAHLGPSLFLSQSTLKFINFVELFKEPIFDFTDFLYNFSVFHFLSLMSILIFIIYFLMIVLCSIYSPFPIS